MEHKDFFNLKFVKHALFISGFVVLPMYLYLFYTNINLFHTIMEYSIITLGFIGGSVGIITSFRLKNNYLSKLSPSIIGYNFFLIFHVLSYGNQNIFEHANDDFSAGLWLMANLFLASGILFSFIRNRDKNSVILRLIITVILVLAIFSIFYSNILPDLVNINGNTLVYIYTVFLIVIIYIANIVIWFINNRLRNNPDYRNLILCLPLLLVSEMLLLNHFSTNTIWIYIGFSLRFIAFLVLTYTILKVNLILPYNDLYLAIYDDNKLQKSLKEEISRSLRRLSRSQEIGHVGSWELNLEYNVIWASDEAFRIYGIPNANNNTLGFEEVKKIASYEDRKRLDQALQDLLLGRRPYDIRFNIITPDGVEKYLHSVATLEFEENKPAMVYGVIKDITELKNEQEKLKWASYHDHLTNVYNRRHFLEQRVALDFEKYLPVSTVILDINGLKVINDSFGHHTGNKVLKSTAKILEENVLEENSFVARIGGDEFAVIYPNTELAVAEARIEKIAKLINEESVGNINLSIAYGLAEKNRIDDSFDDVLKKAEDEMYLHKISDTQSARNKIIDALLKSLYEKDKDSEAHSKRVSDLAFDLAKAANLTEKRASDVFVAGLLHDIGKITIANAIVNKEGKLTDNEYQIVKTHAEKGYKIIHSIGGMDTIANYVLQHHERIDGFGYPRSLKGEDIHLEAKIICIADAYDSMTSIRTYKSMMSKQEAIDELIRCKGSHFDSELVDIFINKVLQKA